MSSQAVSQYEVIRRRLAVIIDLSSQAGGWRLVKPTTTQFQHVAGSDDAQPPGIFLQLPIDKLSLKNLGVLETALVGLNFNPTVEDSATGNGLCLRIAGRFEAERLKEYLSGKHPGIDLVRSGPSPERKAGHKVYDLTVGADRKWQTSSVNGQIADYRVSLEGMSSPEKMELLLALEMLSFDAVETKDEHGKAVLLIGTNDQIARFSAMFDLGAEEKNAVPNTPGF